MPIEIMIGAPVVGVEAQILRQLCHELGDIDVLLLANFEVNHRQIDFLVVTTNYAAIIELKCFRGPIFGDINGDWLLEDFAQQKKAYPGGNPWQQTLAQKFALSDRMVEFQANGINIPKPLGSHFYSEFDAFVCIYPQIDPRSQVTKGDFKVRVQSYSDVVRAVKSETKSRSWNLMYWRSFASNYLHLKSATLEEATDSQVARGESLLSDYRGRLRDFLGHNLPPVLPGTTDAHHGAALIDRLRKLQNQLLVGPSGSAKSFHLRHLVVELSRDSEEVPILIYPRNYRGGPIWPLLQQCAAPFLKGKLSELLGAIQLVDHQPVLIIDALNECPAQHLAEFLRGIQAFVLQHQARILSASQFEIELPVELRSESVKIPLPEGADKREIFAYYAGVTPTEEIGHLCEAFSNAYDLEIAGRCHSRGENPRSRWELYGRYVRNSLKSHVVMTSEFLRRIAGTMGDLLTMTVGRDEFERQAVLFFTAQQVSLALIDELLSCRLLQIGDDYVSFEHELLLDYFRADHLAHLSSPISDLVQELQRPRNGSLLELVLPQHPDPTETEQLLHCAENGATLIAAYRGQCGPAAQRIVRNHCYALLDSAARTENQIAFECQTFQDDNGKTRFVSILESHKRSWTKYGRLLCEVIAENLDEPILQEKFLDMFDQSEARIFNAARAAVTCAGFRARLADEEVVRQYGNGLQYRDPPFFCTAILAAIRNSYTFSRRPQKKLPILDQLLSRVREGTFKFFSLAILIDSQRYVSGEVSLDVKVELAKAAWDTGIYHLRLAGTDLIHSMHREAEEEGTQRLDQIRAVLESFDTNNLFVNSLRMEVLATYEGFEPPVSTEAALEEMKSIIDTERPPNTEDLELLELQEQSWEEFQRDRAYGALGKIFEDIFQGSYWDAYWQLSATDKAKILSLAAMASRPGFHTDWILIELLKNGDADALPVFRHFASRLDPDTSVPQDMIGAFLAGVRGCARWSEAPPVYSDTTSKDHLAWGAVGEILFWTLRVSGSQDSRRRVEDLWHFIHKECAIALPDILHNLQHSQWRFDKGSPPVDLVEMFPDKVRPILDEAIQNRRDLSSLFRHGGLFDSRVFQNVISDLGRIGNADSIAALNEILEDSEWGRFAVAAVHAIRARK
jgi:Nuclease-related domain